MRVATFKALASDPEWAKVALSHIGALFRIERTIADVARNKKEQVRRAKSRPIVDKFFDWCDADAEAERVLDESPLSTAIGYARNQRVALRRFLDDGRLPLSNNISELHLRREVVLVSLCTVCSSTRNLESSIIARIATRATCTLAAAA